MFCNSKGVSVGVKECSVGVKVFYRSAKKEVFCRSEGMICKNERVF